MSKPRRRRFYCPGPVRRPGEERVVCRSKEIVVLQDPSKVPLVTTALLECLNCGRRWRTHSDVAGLPVQPVLPGLPSITSPET